MISSSKRAPSSAGAAGAGAADAAADRTLLLRENKFFMISLPREVGALVTLRELRVSGNGLRALPPELGRLPQLELEDLHLYPNGLLRLPPDCREGDPPEALLDCLRPLAASPHAPRLRPRPRPRPPLTARRQSPPPAPSAPASSQRGLGPLELAPRGYLNLECRGLIEWPAALIEAAGPARLRRLDLDRNSIAEIPPSGERRRGAGTPRGPAEFEAAPRGQPPAPPLPPQPHRRRPRQSHPGARTPVFPPPFPPPPPPPSPDPPPSQALPLGLAQLPRLVFLAALPNPVQELPAAALAIAMASDEALLRHLPQLSDEPSDEAAAPAGGPPREAGTGGAEKERSLSAARPATDALAAREAGGAEGTPAGAPSPVTVRGGAAAGSRAGRGGRKGPPETPRAAAEAALAALPLTPPEFKTARMPPAPPLTPTPGAGPARPAGLAAMSVDDVAVWLQRAGFGALEGAFRANFVSGWALLRLEEADLEQLGLAAPLAHKNFRLEARPRTLR
eukprot:tig00000343_g24276.t1